jgi:hypothetical protein
MTMIRRVTSSVLLLMFSAIYAMPLSAAILPVKASDCCAGGMCARPGHMAKPASAHQTMPDCPMHSQHHESSANYEACNCHPQNESAVLIGYFVLLAPVRVVRTMIQTQIVNPVMQQVIVISQLPETPPPRILPS